MKIEIHTIVLWCIGCIFVCVLFIYLCWCDSHAEPDDWGDILDPFFPENLSEQRSDILVALRQAYSFDNQAVQRAHEVFEQQHATRTEAPLHAQQSTDPNYFNELFSPVLDLSQRFFDLATLFKMRAVPSFFIQI